MRRRSQIEEIIGRINTTSAAILAASEEFGTYSGGAGIVVVYLPKDFRLVTAVASVVNASAAQITVDGFTPNSFTIRTYIPSGGGAVGTQAAFIAKGYR